jgi:hypothetical protein
MSELSNSIAIDLEASDQWELLSGIYQILKEYYTLLSPHEKLEEIPEIRKKSGSMN